MSQDSETPTIAKPLLWLAVTHPGLRHAGNQVYSGGLLDALAQRGQALTLLTQDDGPAVSRITVETAALPASGSWLIRRCAAVCTDCWIGNRGGRW